MRKPSLDTNAETSAETRSGPQSVGRILHILETLAADGGGATLSELAVKTAAPKTSLVGLLAGLTAEGCLERDVAGRYRLGPRFISLAMQAVAGRELITLVRPVMTELVEATGETAVLGALARDEDIATYLDKVETSNPIRYAVTVGERRELYCTAVGKVLLAYFAPARLKAYLKSVPRQRFTPTTVTATRDLQAELGRVRRDGVARTSNERIPGASGIAAPIFASDGGVIAALLIAGPSERIHAASDTIERHLKQAAIECTRLIGGTAPVAAE